MLHGVNTEYVSSQWNQECLLLTGGRSRFLATSPQTSAASRLIIYFDSCSGTYNSDIICCPRSHLAHWGFQPHNNSPAAEIFASTRRPIKACAWRESEVAISIRAHYSPQPGANGLFRRLPLHYFFPEAACRQKVLRYFPLKCRPQSTEMHHS